MRILIRQARIIDKNTPFHEKKVDLLIENGTIIKIGKIEENADKIVEGKNLHVSPGFFDLSCSSADPGHESMESLSSLSAAATAGGFTEVMILPNTTPVIQSKESLRYFQHFSNQQACQLLPAGAVTKNCEGTDFTEMWDMLNAGALAFTDGRKAIWNADILLKTLQYLQPKGALLINRPTEPTLALFGQMHEGIMSTRLGMKGIPDTAEEIMIMRDLKLLEYADIKSDSPVLHFSCLSSAKGVEAIRKAKKAGLPVSCSVAAHQLAFTDESLSNFDTNLKVNPPFRSLKDQKALVKGLADGTIDLIVSDHNPQDSEQKNLEFDLAEFGIVSLQTAFATACMYADLALEDLIEKMSDNPRKILKRAVVKINVNQAANLVVYDPAQEFIFETKDIRSLSTNSPFIGKKLKGKIIGVINNNIWAD